MLATVFFLLKVSSRVVALRTLLALCLAAAGCALPATPSGIVNGGSFDSFRVHESKV